MRFPPWCLLPCLLLLGWSGVALADGDASKPGPGEPLPMHQALPPILAAHAKGEDLAALAENTSRQSWFVIDALLGRGARDTAVAIAAAYENGDKEGLRRYAATGPVGPDANARRALRGRVFAAFGAKKHDEVLALLTEEHLKDHGDMVALQFMDVRASSLEAKRELRGACLARVEAGKRAEALGWYGVMVSQVFRGGNAALRFGLYDEAEACWSRILRTAKPRDDQFRVASALVNRAGLRRAQGRLDEGFGDLDVAIALCRKHDFKSVLGNALEAKANAHSQAGRLEEALPLQEAALAVRREDGKPGGILSGLGNLGSQYARVGRFEDSLAMYQEGLALARAEKLPDYLARLSTSMGVLESTRCW